MVHRGIATLAGALVVSFLLLSNADQPFFMLHFYQSLIYLFIILMLFYFEDQYAYMVGMIAPVFWLIGHWALGLMGGSLRQVSRLLHAQTPTSQSATIGAVISVLSILMAVLCAYRWKREFSGLHKMKTTFLVSLLIVVVYYGLLIVWFWSLVPAAPAT